MSITPQFVFDEIAKGIKADPSLISKIGGVFHFKVGGKSWMVDLKNSPGCVKASAPEKADCIVIANDNDFVDMMTGKANGQSLFMQGKLKLQGNMGLAMKLDKIPKTQPNAVPPPAPAAAAVASSASSSDVSGFKATAVFDELTKRIAVNKDLVKQIAGVYQFNISAGNKSESWTVDLKNGNGSVAIGKANKADCTLTVGDEDFVGMMTGKLNSQQLFMQGKLKIAGNMAFAMKLNKLQAAKAAL